MKNIFRELQECLQKRDIWLVLSIYDIKARYKRTVIGPLWLTLGTAITILGMGLVWSSIFHLNINEFLPYIASGMIVWTFIAAILNEGCSVFSSQASVIHNVKLSLFIHIMTLVSRNLIILSHNFFVIILIFIICGQKVNLEIVWLIPGMIMLILHSFWVSVVIGIFATRYRDIASIVGSLTTLIMLVTPIMWKTDMLTENRQLIATVNPFAHMISIIRDPLLGICPTFGSYLILGTSLILGWVFALFLYKKYSVRLIYWI